MAHYSEMNFLFNTTNNGTIDRLLDQTSLDNTHNIFREKSYVVYKSAISNGTNSIKTYLQRQIYESMQSNNPYIDILNTFKERSNTPGAGLRIKAADLAYLRDLGVYPINRMIILRRFPEGCFVPENLGEMTIEPISTVIGWIKPEQNFGNISFNETWGTTNERFDIALTEILKKATGSKVDGASMVPVPDFAQGLLFEFYKKVGITKGTIENDEDVEYYNRYDSSSVNKEGLSIVDKNLGGSSYASGQKYTDVENVNWWNSLTAEQKKEQSSQNTARYQQIVGDNPNAAGNSDAWGLKNIPVGNPNVLQTAPYRDPNGQNIQSSFQFDIETIYEQKLLGDVDPGSAMLDVIENLYAMGTSNMVFYWGSESDIIKKAKEAASGSANNLNAWWIFVSSLMIKFWDTIKDMFMDVKNKVVGEFKNAQTAYNTDGVSGLTAALAKKEGELTEFITNTLETILTSTISIHRFRLRGSLELMIGGKDSSTPWHLTLGNPYSPWLATNHIVVDSASIETSTEMGFNDQPQWIKAKFTCKFSRPLGKQELMRMFNNTYRRAYSILPTDQGVTKTTGSNIESSNTQQKNIVKT